MGSFGPMGLSSLLLFSSSLFTLLLLLSQSTLAQDPSVTSVTATESDPSALPTQPANQTSTASGYEEESQATPPAETGLSTPTSGGDADDEDVPPMGGTRCQGYYDVMGQWDPPFNCNAGLFLYCCGTCFYRFCCQFRRQWLDQSICSNYDTPLWANTGKPVATITDGVGMDRDRTHLVVYMICGVVAIMVLVGIFTKLGMEKRRGGSGAAGALGGPEGGAGGGEGQGGEGGDISNSRTLTELLKQPGGEGTSANNTTNSSPPAARANGISSRIARSRSEQYHLNSSGHGPFGQGLPQPNSAVGLNKYTSLRAVADSASRSYYKSYPLMDFAQQQPVAPPAFQPVPLRHKEKSYLHQTPPPARHDLHGPLSISIPAGHLASSAFKAWETNGRHVQRQTSVPGHTSAPMHPTARRHAYSTRRQQSIENMPDLFTQPCIGAYGGGAPGPGRHLSYPSHYHHTRRKSYSTHSKTEVTV